jgi:FkbM family methyltransferase
VNRPLALRLLPDRIRVAVWSRLYRRAQSQWIDLYQDAELAYAPGVTMGLVPGDIISDCLAFTGIYELATTRRVLSLARRGGLLVDVGANLGYFSLLWTAARPDNRCIAFEAAPRNIEILRRNVARNRFGERIKIVPCAAGKNPGRLRFDIGPAEQTGWGGFSADAASGIEVDVVRVDDVVSTDTGRVDLLKVDIEGADAWALMGCEKLLAAKSVGEVWFEQNKPRSRALGLNDDAAAEFLRSVGYCPHAIDEIADDVVEWSARPA